MNVRELWARAQRWYAGHGTRDRRILAGVAAAVVVSLLYVGVAEPIVHYRRRVADEVGEGQEQLERSARFLAAGDGLRVERDDLKQRLGEAAKPAEAEAAEGEAEPAVPPAEGEASENPAAKAPAEARPEAPAASATPAPPETPPPPPEAPTAAEGPQLPVVPPAAVPPAPPPPPGAG